MSDKPFRVLLDLTELHIENFKYVWINVSPRELRTISDFKTALLHKINLEREDIKLFVRDGLLLEQETIIVLREDDTVKVQYEEHSQSFSTDNSGKESKKSSRKRNCNECNISDVPLNKKKCKIDSELSNTSNEINLLEVNNEKRKKHKKSLNSVSSDNIVNHSEPVENSHTKVKCQKNKKRPLLENNITKYNLDENRESFFSFDVDDTVACKSNATSSVSVNLRSNTVKFDSTKDSSPKTNDIEHEHTKEMDISGSFVVNMDVKKAEGVNSTKKKRKRNKKRKMTESTVTDVTQNIDANTNFVSISENVGDITRTHIIYSSDSCEKDYVEICDASRGQNSSRDTFAVTKDKSNVKAQSFRDYPKISTPTLADGCNNPSWQVSLMQSRNSIYSSESLSCKKEYVKEVTQDKPVVIKDVLLQNFEGNKFPRELHYEDLPPLNSMPTIGAHIVYKTLELDEHYSPEVSEYREGIVKSINLDSEEIEIELLKQFVKPGRTGKFENLKDDEIPFPEVKKKDVLRWSALILPKQL